MKISPSILYTQSLGANGPVQRPAPAPSIPSVKPAGVAQSAARQGNTVTAAEKTMDGSTAEAPRRNLPRGSLVDLRV